MIYIKIRKQSWQLKQNKNNNIIKLHSNNKIFTRIFAVQCNIVIVKTRTTKAQLSEKKNSKSPTDTGHFHTCNHQEWLGDTTVNNVQINPQTTDIWSEKLFVTS